MIENSLKKCAYKISTNQIPHTVIHTYGVTLSIESPLKIDDPIETRVA